MGAMVQDLIEDRVRFRAVTVGIVVVMYLLLTYDLLETTQLDAKTTINSIAFSSTLPSFMYMGAGLAHAPAIQALDEISRQASFCSMIPHNMCGCRGFSRYECL
jgi:hypothetical protein